MSSTDDAIAATINKLNAIADAHGADAIALGSRVLQVSAISDIIAPLFITIGFLCLLSFSWRMWTRDTEGDSDDQEIGMALLYLFTGISGFVSMGLLVFYTFNPVVWLSALDGRFALAAKIVARL